MRFRHPIVTVVSVLALSSQLVLAQTPAETTSVSHVISIIEQNHDGSLDSRVDEAVASLSDAQKVEILNHIGARIAEAGERLRSLDAQIMSIDPSDIDAAKTLRSVRHESLRIGAGLVGLSTLSLTVGTMIDSLSILESLKTTNAPKVMQNGKIVAAEDLTITVGGMKFPSFTKILKNRISLVARAGFGSDWLNVLTKNSALIGLAAFASAAGAESVLARLPVPEVEADLMSRREDLRREVSSLQRVASLTEKQLEVLRLKLDLRKAPAARDAE